MSDVEKPDIEAVYSYYELQILGRDNGGWAKAQCPIPDHEDRNPSASVNISEGKFWCHACGRGGDGYDIIREREGFAGFSDCKSFARQFLDGSGEAVRGDSGSGGSLSVRPRRKPGYRNEPRTAPWLRL